MWAAPRRFQSGYDAGDPRVKRMMEALVDIQQEDGGWRPFFAQASSPVYTLLAVKALILSGILVRQELAAKVTGRVLHLFGKMGFDDPIVDESVEGV